MTLLYAVEDLPTLQNRVYSTKEEAQACVRGTIRLTEDADTGLIYNAAFDPSLMVYDEHYQNEQGNSAHFRRHLASIADLIEQKMGLTNLVEVGCGKGFFLDMLVDRGAEIVGCDPTYEGTNPAIIKEFFSADIGLPAGGNLILRHVLEHIPNPAGFLQSLAQTNGNKGLLYVEVPCFDWILDHRAWFDVFYEHVNYFRMSDFERMFGRLVHAERTFGGQYLSVIVDLATFRSPVFDPALSVTMPQNFAPDLETFEAHSTAWGAASKGVIFSIMMERAGKPVAQVIDINPVKQGRYLPVTGAPVVSPEVGLSNCSGSSTIYVMNSNYLAEIQGAAGDDFRCLAIDKF